MAQWLIQAVNVLIDRTPGVCFSSVEAAEEGRDEEAGRSESHRSHANGLFVAARSWVKIRQIYFVRAAGGRWRLPVV